jgi:dihydroflavonol-4-reductase
LKTLVTGATGYIGPFLINRLKKDGHEVSVLVRKKDDFDRLKSEGFNCLLGDLTDKESLNGIFDNIEVLFHLANIASWWLPRKQDYYDINVGGTINLLEEAKDSNLAKIIYTSSVAAIRQPKGIVATETSIHQGDFESDYSKSKYLVEKEIDKYKNLGLPIVTLNPGVVTGPHDFKSFGQTLIGIANGKIKSKFFPESYVPLVYIDDVIDILINALDIEAGKKYIVVGENIKIGDIFDKVCKILNREKIDKVTPEIFLLMLAYFSESVSFLTRKRPFLPIDGLKAIEIGATASAQKSIDELGFKYLNADQILAKSIEWYKKNNYINN